MNKAPFVSICIPAYNRPDKLYRLLTTIDAQYPSEVEVVVSDDFSPRRTEIGVVVERFKKESKYVVVLCENEKNLGYDGNIKRLVKNARGEWLVFMGDDDEFIPQALDKLIAFIKRHKDIVYVLRAYDALRADGGVEKFRYYSEDTFFAPGEETYREIFRKSVFISGFAIKRELVLPYLIDYFDGHALIQIYWVAELVLKYRSAYFNEPIAVQIDDDLYKAKEVMHSEHDKKIIISRPVNLKRSLYFLEGYLKIARFMDEKRGLHSYGFIMRDLSKYSYPSLSVHRDKGVHIFLEYVHGLDKLGFNVTPYYYVYVFLLIIFGKKLCNLGIRMIKKILGRTPHL